MAGSGSERGRTVNRKTLKLVILLIVMLVFPLYVLIATDFSSSVFDTATPAGTDSPTAADDRMREIKDAVQTRSDVDHYWEKTGTEVSDPQTGEHRKITYQAGISDPTHVSGKAHLYMKSDELYYQDDTNTTLQMTDAGTLNITSDDLVGTLANDTYFSAVDNAGTGTVDLIKANTSDLAILPDSAALEVATASAATSSDRTIADKGYADTKEAALVTQATASIFGTRTFTDTVSAALVKGTVYKAQCDGFLTVSRNGDTGNEFTVFVEQGDNTPDITVALIEMNNNVNNGITIPLRKDDFVTLTQTLGSSAITYMSFLPIGTGGLVAQ